MMMKMKMTLSSGRALILLEAASLMLFAHSDLVLQDCVGLPVRGGLGLPPHGPLQLRGPGGLLPREHVGGGVALRARRAAERPRVE